MSYRFSLWVYSYSHYHYTFTKYIVIYIYLFNKCSSFILLQWWQIIRTFIYKSNVSVRLNRSRISCFVLSEHLKRFRNHIARHVPLFFLIESTIITQYIINMLLNNVFWHLVLYQNGEIKLATHNFIIKEWNMTLDA